MRKALILLASLKLTLIGMILVVAVALATYKEPGPGTEWLAIPLALLSLNLFAAILVNKQFRRQRGLLVFHLGLLAVILLAGAGLLNRFEGHVEIAEGQSFDPHAVETIHRGIWHSGGIDTLQFAQGPIEVNFAPGLIRRSTRSTVHVPGSAGASQSIQFGDRESFAINGYRFITTFNKGLALLLTYQERDSIAVSGTVNFPSYPLLEWKQKNEWLLPDGSVLQLELLPQQTPHDDFWTLRSQDLNFAVHIQGVAVPPATLQTGDSLDVGPGIIRIQELRLWMGYRIDYNPVLPWLFAAAIAAIVGLGLHFRSAFVTADRPLSNRSVGAGAANVVNSVN